MGVTLERVQNKFACIIGELCSEPLLLSQFAIWVDLRISEYKSKGTISLDCSGTTPDPSWLKGHVVQSIPTAGSSDNGRGRSGSASIRNSLPHKSIHSSRDPGRGSNYPSNNRTDGNVDNSDIGSDRISPDVQVIKQESDSAFPVSLHQHSAKKRHSEDDLSQGESFYEDSSFSGPKVRRMDSAADESSAVDSPSNQSFMSVIGDSLQDNDDASDNSMMVAGDEQSKGGNQSFGFTPRAGTSFSMPSTSATPGTSSSAVASGWPGYGVGTPSIGLERRKGEMRQPPEATEPSVIPSKLSRKSIRERVMNKEQKSTPTIGNIVNAVCILERWIWKTYGDERNIETMPPQTLDFYLVDFYPTLKKPSGDDYDADSWTNYRSYLDRFLKEHNYPCSLSRSAEFARSQSVFKLKRKWLSGTRKWRQQTTVQGTRPPLQGVSRAGNLPE